MINTKGALCIAALMATLGGCASTQTTEPQTTPLQHMYDYQLLNQQGEAISFSQLTQALQDADVVFIGEYHSHPASHLLETQLFTALHQQHPRLILSMEQFTRDHQSVIDRYLSGEIGEERLKAEADAWNNYPSDYRPLVEYARLNNLPVVAANTPIEVVRCVSVNGPEVLSELTEQAQGWVASDLSNADPAYLDKYIETSREMASKCAKPDEDKIDAEQPVHHHGHGHGSAGKKKHNSFSAQLARDNTMADSIHQALKAHPGHKVVHTNGTFHSEEQLGTVAALKRLNPQLNIQVITPVYAEDEFKLTSDRGRNWGNYLYLIQPMPELYLQEEFCNQGMADMMKKRSEQQCTLMKEANAKASASEQSLP